MFGNYSASKRRSSIAAVKFEDSIRNSIRIQKVPVPYNNYAYDFQQNVNIIQRPSSGVKQRYQQLNKQNYNNQTKLEMRITSAHSPLKQPLYSPLKNPSSYQSYKQTLGTSIRKVNINQAQGISSYESKSTAKKAQQKIYNNLKPSLYRNHTKNETNCETNSKNEQNNKINKDFAYTFSNISSPYVTHTPQKHNRHIEVNQLVQKSQFIKQKIDRISRMTPQSTTRRQQFPKEQQTPQKIFQIPLEKKQPINNIIKYNKFYNENLPLQAIYDSQQQPNYQNTNKNSEQVQQGIQKINSLSKKINERLKNIIDRHSK